MRRVDRSLISLCVPYEVHPYGSSAGWLSLTNSFIHSIRSLLPIAAAPLPRRCHSALLIGGPGLEGPIIRQAAVNEGE